MPLRVANDRIEEINDHEIGIDRLMETYLKKGYCGHYCRYCPL